MIGSFRHLHVSAHAKICHCFSRQNPGLLTKTQVPSEWQQRLVFIANPALTQIASIEMETAQTLPRSAADMLKFGLLVVCSMLALVHAAQVQPRCQNRSAFCFTRQKSSQFHKASNVVQLMKHFASFTFLFTAFQDCISYRCATFLEIRGRAG